MFVDSSALASKCSCPERQTPESLGGLHMHPLAPSPASVTPHPAQGDLKRAGSQFKANTRVLFLTQGVTDGWDSLPPEAGEAGKVARFTEGRDTVL